MFCPTCGIALPRPTKFCRSCGARLQLPEQTEVTPLEKRFDEYLDGLFWTIFFGLGFVLGGMVLFSRVLRLGQGFVIAYMVLSALAFLIVFGLSLWQTLVMAKALHKPIADVLPPARATDKMLPSGSEVSAEPVVSVTENTTRNFQPVPVETVGKEGS
jgi:hypothetical protein